MRRFPTLLVGLSLGADDPSLLAHVAALAPRLGTEHVRLVHVVPGPPDVALPTEVEEAVRSSLEAASAQLDVACTTALLVGGVALRLLQETVECGADVICLGRGGLGRSAALGTSVGAIVRKAPCSVLVVPRDRPVDLSRAIVPVDFSVRSGEALEVAVGLASPSGRGTVLALYAYELPLGWRRAGAPEAERVARAEGNARDRWRAFVAPLQSDVKLGFRPLRDPVPHLGSTPHGPTLIAEINEQAPGLVVTTSRGRTLGAALLLGSVASRLVNGVDAPCLVLKHKGETMGVLEALKIL